MPMKTTLLLGTLLCLLTLAHPALAQHNVSGCSDASPENPTVILAGMASGAYALSAVRTRFRARRRNRDQ